MYGYFAYSCSAFVSGKKKKKVLLRIDDETHVDHELVATRKNRAYFQNEFFYLNFSRIIVRFFSFLWNDHASEVVECAFFASNGLCHSAIISHLHTTKTYYSYGNCCFFFLS